MRIRVISCVEPSFWYADRIGEEFEVTHIIQRWGYAVGKRGSWTLVINFSDAEVI